MSACPNCGYDQEASCIGNIPVEDLVDGEVRKAQYELALQGLPYRHSNCIATRAPERKEVPA